MPRVLVHCPAAGGHHGTYVRFLLEHPRARRSELGLLLPSDFAQWHPEIIARANALGVPLLTSLLGGAAPGRLSSTAFTLRSFHEIASAAEELGAEQCLWLYADPFVQLGLPLGGSARVSFSGILFRNTAHYPESYAPLTPGERLRSLRHRLALQRAVGNPRLRRLYWLDPFGAERARARDPDSAHKHVWLPDPLDAELASELQASNLRQRLRIPPNWRVLLMFGPPGARKGTLELLDALGRLPAELGRESALLMVGAMAEDQRVELTRAVERAARRFTGRILVIDDFVSEAETACYFQLADVVVIPYQRHVGSSGVLLRAARAGKPVLASDFGLVGEWTRRHALGELVDAESRDSLLQGLASAVSGDIARHFDARTAQGFSERFSKAAFVEALLDS